MATLVGVTMNASMNETLLGSASMNLGADILAGVATETIEWQIDITLGSDSLNGTQNCDGSGLQPGYVKNIGRMMGR